MEQELKDMPLHIINGFQLNDHSAKLFGYALDMVRLGADIDESFWTDHIVADDTEIDLLDKINITGPVITRRDFDVFESLETCRRNAHIILEGMIDGMSTICSELELAFADPSGVSSYIRKKAQNMLRTETLNYLTEFSRSHKLNDIDVARRRSAYRFDSAPVLLAISSGRQYVWNGEWRALLASDISVREEHFRNWYYNHVISYARLKQIVLCHLYTAYADYFKRS